jgi:nucleotide-binding universal stress UspA family protein
MFNKLQAGVDESSRSCDAAALAQVLAGALRSDLLLVSAYQDPLLPFPLTISRDAHPGRDARRRLAAVRASCAPIGHTVAVPDFSPARALRRTARDRGADLLVLGSGRHVPAGHAGAGRMGCQVLHDAPCAVAFASVGLHEFETRVRRIVVGVDEGAESRVALGLAAGLGRAAGAAVEAVAVADDRLHVHGWGAGVVSRLVDWDDVVELRRQRLVARLGEIVGAAGADVSGDVRVGDPASELCDCARGADLLVVGSRGWGALDRIAVGSTAEVLSHDTPCSLLVVPRPSVEVAPTDRADALPQVRMHRT